MVQPDLGQNSLDAVAEKDNDPFVSIRCKLAASVIADCYGMHGPLSRKELIVHTQAGHLNSNPPRDFKTVVGCKHYLK